MSKHRNKHLEVRVEGNQHIAACAFSSTWGDLFATDEDGVTCPMCSGIVARKQLAERPADAPKLELIRSHDEHIGGLSYRFIYKAMLDDEQVAWIVYEGAYGKAVWRICAVRLAEPGDPRVVGYQLAHEHRAMSFHSKDQALLAIPAFRAEGRLPSLAELVEKAAKAARQEAIWQAERKNRDAQRAIERRTMRDGIKSLLRRGDLTDLERRAVILLQQLQATPEEEPA